MQLTSQDIPIAFAMVALAKQAPVPTQAYLCYGAAFKNIITVLAARSGLRPRFGLRKNGTLRTRKVNAKFKMAEVYPSPENIILERAFKHFSSDLKHRLITHENTRYFVYRTPTWDNAPIKRDAYQQQLNGVINVGLTLDPRYPIWTPIDIALYRQYIGQSSHDETPDAKTQTVLAQQIITMLTTIQQNLHFAGTDHAENNPEVLNKALVLLAMIVEDFLHLSEA